jgi:HrpA-like RNA helicase
LFFKRWNKGDIDGETTISSSTSQQLSNSSITNHLSRLNLNRNEDREHMSDIEGQTDPDGVQSEGDKEEIRQIFGISHALETFDDYKEIKQWINQDTTLPVYSQKDKILSIIQINSITIIQGNTGSGKSTQIPQYILDDYVKQSKPVNIVVTQPRRIAARSLCEYISYTRNWPIGQTIGYQTSLNKQRCELTRILYCTTGVLLQRLILTKTLQDFTHIILDEVNFFFYFKSKFYF